MPKKGRVKTVRGAVRKGWHPVTLTQEQRSKHQVSHWAIHNWCQTELKGHFKTSFDQHHLISRFAFELEEDLTWFSMRWL